MIDLEKDIEDTRDAVCRQLGCPDKECNVCRANKRRAGASERVIALARVGLEHLNERGLDVEDWLLREVGK